MTGKPILAFDCATAGASISLLAEGTTVTHTVSQGKQSAELVSKIDMAMTESGVNYADLGTIITTIGPGSFTGLRIGLAALHGFVLVHKTPIKTVTTLESFAWSVARTNHASSPAEYLVAVRAGKGEIYVQAFSQKEGKPSATGDIFLAPETQTQWPAPLYSNHLPTDSDHYTPGVDTELLCRIAEHLPESTLAAAVPLYIRPPDAIIPKTAPWLTT